MWAVVAFDGDKSVEAVPSHWFKNNRCAYPKKNAKRFIENKAKVTKFEFNIFSARILKNNLNSLVEARNKARKAEKTSDLSSTSDSNENRKNKYLHKEPPQFIDSSSPKKLLEIENSIIKDNLVIDSEEDSTIQSSDNSLYSPLTKKKSFKRGLRFSMTPSPSKKNCVQKRTIDGSIILVSPSSLNKFSENTKKRLNTFHNTEIKLQQNIDANIRKTSSVTDLHSPQNGQISAYFSHPTFNSTDFCDSRPSSGPISSGSSQVGDKLKTPIHLKSATLSTSFSNMPSSNTTTLQNDQVELIMNTLLTIKRAVLNNSYNIRAIDDKIHKIQENSLKSVTTIQTNYSSEYSDLMPISSDEQLQIVENKLKSKDDNSLKTYLISELSRFEKKKLSLTVRSMLQKMFSDAILSCYSYKGQKKKAFSSLSCCTIILDTIKQIGKFHLVPNGEIEEVIRTYLAGAPSRLSSINKNSISEEFGK